MDLLKASIRELGTYTVALDTVPPEIIPVNKNLWGRNGKIVYRLKDEGAGIASYRGTIDGEYALFGRPNIVKSYWECVLDPKHVKKGGQAYRRNDCHGCLWKSDRFEGNLCLVNY